ncbi:LacI family DNA-binding transcriptional regulator [Spongiimicrobium sp. 3-5]|uniref:LacI family DNA-binding transcriptional regulator n=1 Tax=Spongiimicrobium sp. 3-5 TaxID=3332596 RepID=UPI00397F1E11
MKQKLTLKDIAAHFKVSVSTVSKALNDSYEISSSLKRKITNYAKKHHYRPNINAVNLRKEQAATIGVIIPNILNYFFAQVFSGIEKVANKKGYNIISCISNESLDKEVATTEMLKNGLVSGLLVSLSEETEKLQKIDHFKKFTEIGIPLVMFDRVSDAVLCDKIIVDDFEGAYNATSHFINSGCRRIAVVSILDNLQIGRQRIEGYKKCLLDHNILVDERLILRNFEADFLETQIKTLLKTHEVDAILGLEEFTAISSMTIAKDIGFRIPDDISIIGFTNGMLPKYVTPTITSVSQHGRYIGEKATEMLISRIEEDSTTTTPFDIEVLKTSLVLRGSTRN